VAVLAAGPYSSSSSPERCPRRPVWSCRSPGWRGRFTRTVKLALLLVALLLLVVVVILLGLVRVLRAMLTALNELAELVRFLLVGSD
jgi:hypothetical protein